MIKIMNHKERERQKQYFLHNNHLNVQEMPKNRAYYSFFAEYFTLKADGSRRKL